MQLLQRPRRNRKCASIRSLIRENILTVKDLIAPLFVIDGDKIRKKIDSMPGQYRFSIDCLVEEVKDLYSLGIPAVCLFPVLSEKLKDPMATQASNPDGFYQNAIREIKKQVPDILIMTDVALDPYSSMGHDGIYDPASGEIKNDETLQILANMSLEQARAGADIIGPSDMMDGRVGVIRESLEKDGHSNVAIMSYTAKYASSFYGPFRDALDSTPKKGDKKTYQIDYHNVREAVRELFLDEEEGADIVMVKPGLAYLDVIKELKCHSTLPVAAYNVSGEYAMVKAAHQNGWLNGPEVMVEMLTAFKRAGADMILTYFAKEMAQVLVR